MRFVQWSHNRRTMARHAADPYAPLDPAMLFPCTQDGERGRGEGEITVVTFRSTRAAAVAVGGWREERVVDATSRFAAGLPDLGGETVLAGLETDTRLAPLIVWDLFHAAPLGARFTVVEDACVPHCFERRYYAGLLTVERRDVRGGAVAVTYRKTAPAPIAADAGLDAWTFGIPTGPGDASALNACVGRILSLGIPDTEIILCGQVGGNFHYHDQVRIIGGDLPVTPIRIGEKKNRLAAAASYGNLCLLHDRIILPRGFYAAVREFGDDYPFTTFQSLYFYDRWNLHGQRYADTETLVWRPLGAFEADGGGKARPWVFGEERYHQSYGHAASYDGGDYVIGGLYMAKRSLWRLCPQDGSRTWMEWEDIEHGTRAAAWGIPGRVNPFAFTQSLQGRFRTLGCQRQAGDDGVYQHRIVPSLPFLPSPSRKPHLRMEEETYRANLLRFIRTHVPEERRPAVEAAVAGRITFRRRAALMHLILANAQVRRTGVAVDAFIRDVFALLIGEGAEPPYYWRALREELLHGQDPERLRRAVMRHWVVRGPMRYYPLRTLFGADVRNLMSRPAGIALTLTTALGALYLWLFRRRTVHVRGGPWALTQAILDCTPVPSLLEPGAAPIWANHQEGS